jgi:PAS domain S-box-containing protein
MDPIPNDQYNNEGDNDNDNDNVDLVNPLIMGELENIMPDDLLDHPAIRAFQSSDNNFIVTNPRLPGNPIIYVSPLFLELTGYAIHRVLGRNCRFLQGPETDPVAVARMREAIENGRHVNVTLLNYRQDGSTFWNRILISGIRNAYDEVIYFLGLQHSVPQPEGEGGVAAPSHMYIG